MWKATRCLALILLATGLIAPAGPGAAAPGKKVQAAALAEEGWRIMKTPPVRATSEAGARSGPAKTAYHTVCDAAEAAQKFFRRAVELDPANASAWNGWGRTLEGRELCFSDSPLTWNQQNLLEYYDRYKCRILEYYDDLNKPRYYNFFTPAGPAEAADKFQKATEHAPKEAVYWADWGRHLLKRAEAEKNDGLRRRLTAQGSEKLTQAARLKPEDRKLHLDWAWYLLSLLSAEDDPELWPKILGEALEHLDKYLAEPRPEAQKSESGGAAGLEGLEQAPASYILMYMYPDEGLTAEKKQALLRAALDRLEFLQRDPVEDSWQVLPFIHLLAAFSESDPSKRAEQLAQARELLEQKMFRDGREKADFFPLYSLINWAHIVDSPEQQGALAEEVLALFRKIEGLVSLGPDEPLSRLDLNLFLAEVYAFLPEGRRREELGLEIRHSLEADRSLLAKEPGDKHRLLTLGNVLLRMAASEKDEARYQAALKEAAGWFEEGTRSDNKVGAYVTWIMYLDWAARDEKNLDRRRMLWEEALDKSNWFNIADRPGGWGWTPGLFTYKLSLLEEKGSFIRRGLVRRALNRQTQMVHGLEAVGNDSDSAHLRFFLGLLLTNIAFSPDGQRSDLLRAMAEFRQYFTGLPAAKEREARTKAGHGKIYSDPGQNQERSFKEDLTASVAKQLFALYKAYHSDRTPAWGLTQLAGLHRYLAFSGWLTPAYQELYLDRAEAALRQAVAREIEAEEMSEPPKAKPVSQRSAADRSRQTENLRNQLVLDRALAMSELGLLSAERGRLRELGLLSAGQGRLAIGSGPAGLQAAEQWWAEAEKLVPGSSRYARARWAARQKRVREMKKYLSHSLAEVSTQRYPTLAEARDDPALAAYIDEPWFEKIWYGLGQTPESPW